MGQPVELLEILVSSYTLLLVVVNVYRIIHSVVVRHVPVGVDCRASVMIF